MLHPTTAINTPHPPLIHRATQPLTVQRPPRPCCRRDKERGVVWEESIILAPKTARFAFLSATIPNSREFADWVAKTHGSPCHVVYTGGQERVWQKSRKGRGSQLRTLWPECRAAPATWCVQVGCVCVCVCGRGGRGEARALSGSASASPTHPIYSCARPPAHLPIFPPSPPPDYRPTPLEHYIFPAGGDGLFLVVDNKGTFR